MLIDLIKVIIVPGKNITKWLTMIRRTVTRNLWPDLFKTRIIALYPERDFTTVEDCIIAATNCRQIISCDRGQRRNPPTTLYSIEIESEFVEFVHCRLDTAGHHLHVARLTGSRCNEKHKIPL